MLSTIWLEVLQFATRADIDAIQLVSGCLNVAVANNIKSLPLRPFTLLRVKGCLHNDPEQTIHYYSPSRTEKENVSSDAFDRVLCKLSNGYVEQVQIDCFCSDSFGLFLASQPGLDLVRFGLFRCVTDFYSSASDCMIAPAMVFAAMQFQPVGYVVSWNGSQHGPTMVALSIPLVRNSIKHLVLTTDGSCFSENKSEFLLDFLTSAHPLETCTICSFDEAEVAASWLSAFIKRLKNSQERGHRFSRLCVISPSDDIDDDLGEGVQSKFSNRDSELGFHPNRAALEQDAFKMLAPEEGQGHWNFVTTGQGRVNRYKNHGGRKLLSLFTWEVEVQRLDEIDANGKVGFAVLDISEMAYC